MHSGLKVYHIVAMAQNRVIGREGGMPWHIPEDFKFFKETTMGHVMIMGRKTWSSIGRALPGRQTIVVSRSKDTPLAEGVVRAASLEEAFEWCKEHESTWGSEVFVVGGGELYRQSLPVTDRIYLTEVHKAVDGDTTYPAFSTEDFQLVERKESANDSVSFDFCQYDRKC